MFSNYELWSENFHRLTEIPPEGIIDFSEIAERHEDWWQCRNTRPLFLAKGCLSDRKTGLRYFELLENPNEWLKAKLECLRQIDFLFDSLPFVHLDLGANYLAFLAGAGIQYNNEQAWIMPSQEIWNEIPDIQTVNGSDSWLKLLDFTGSLARFLFDRALFMSPNLGSPADALMNRTGPERFFQFLIDQPEEVKTAITQIFDIWHFAYSRIMDICVENKLGLIHWCEIWSKIPYLILECEASAMVGKNHFQEFFIPDIRRQALTVKRSIYHLCGEDAFRHLDDILNIPEIHALQYVPRKGNPAIDRLKELKKIQKKGLPVQIAISPDEARDLIKVLDPAGLSFLIFDPLSREEIKELSKDFSD